MVPIPVSAYPVGFYPGQVYPGQPVNEIDYYNYLAGIFQSPPIGARTLLPASKDD